MEEHGAKIAATVENAAKEVTAFFRRVPKKAWILMGLGVAGIVFIQGAGKLRHTGIGQIVAKGRRRLTRNRHHSICHYVKIQPAAINSDDPLKKRKFCAQDM